MPSSIRHRSLLVETVRRLALWATPLVLAVTTVGYTWTYEQAEADALRDLKFELAEQALRESAIFRLAADNAAAFRTRMLELYADPAVLPADDTDVLFDRYFFRDAEGATRLRPELFEGTIGPDGLRHAEVTGFSGADVQDFDAELKRRMVLSYRLVAQYGPAWTPRFTNFHLSLPENTLINYWPGEPWGLKARADLRMQDFSTLKSTLIPQNPTRAPVWTPLYYDLTAGAWTVTYQLPIDHGGRHLANASFDILLTDLVDRLIRSGLDGAVNLVITSDGKLVAGPDLVDTDKQSWGNIPIDRLDDPQIRWIDRQIRDGGATVGEVRVISDRDHDSWVAVTRIDGPGWAYASIYPKERVAATARQAANAILIVSLALFGVMVAVVYGVLRSRVARPIAALEAACERMATGDFAAITDDHLPLPVDDRSEIGVLARAFRDMAVQVRGANENLEAQVAARTRALQAANARLSELSMLDGLTGAFNRRAFEEDLTNAFERAKAGGPTFSLLLCDVDHFKRYNDMYGHDAGDEVLRATVRAFVENLRAGDRVYRFGGEEIAVLLDQVDDRAARPVAHRIVRAAQDLAIRHDGSAHQVVTVSGGLAGYDRAMASPQDLTRLADAKLYRSKQLGRNTLTV